MRYKQKFIIWILLLAMLVPPGVSQVQAAEPTGLIVLLCDNETFANEGSSVSQYSATAAQAMEDYLGFPVSTDIYKIDYEKYKAGASSLSDLSPGVWQVVVKDLAAELEKAYRSKGLIGVVLFGMVPVPEVSQSGNKILSLYPYLDFDDKAYVFDENQGYFVSTDKEPRAEVWGGVIRAAEGKGLGGFVSRVSEYHEGGIRVEPRVFYQDTGEEEQKQEELQGKSAEEQADGVENYVAAKENMIAKSGRWQLANRSGDGFDGGGQKEEPFEPEIKAIDIAWDVGNYFKGEFENRENLLRTVAGIPDIIMTYLGWIPGAAGPGARDVAKEDLLNEILKAVGVSSRLYFWVKVYADWTKANILIKDFWRTCWEDRSKGLEKSTDLFNSTYNSKPAWFQLAQIVATAGSNGALVYPKDGPGTLKINGYVLNEIAAIVHAGDILEPQQVDYEIYYTDEPQLGVEGVYDEGLDNLFEDHDEDEKYDDGEEVFLGQNGMADINEDQPYQIAGRTHDGKKVLIVYFDQPDSYEELSISGAYTVLAKDPDNETIVGGAYAGLSFGDQTEYEFWMSFFYMSWDEFMSLIAKKGTPAYGKYRVTAGAEGTSFELQYLRGQGEKYFCVFDTMISQGTGEEPLGKPEKAQPYTLGSECWDVRLGHSLTVLQIMEGWQAGFVENAGPQVPFGAWLVSEGRTLALLARTKASVQANVDADGRLNLASDAGNIRPETLGDVSTAVNDSVETESRAQQNKLASILEAGGADAPSTDNGFGENPFLLSFSAGVPLGIALRNAGWPVNQILFGDPTVSLQAIEENE